MGQQYRDGNMEIATRGNMRRQQGGRGGNRGVSVENKMSAGKDDEA